MSPTTLGGLAASLESVAPEIRLGGGLLIVVLLLLALYRLRTARRTAEERTRSGDALAHRLAALETTRDGLAVAGPSGRFVYANDGLAELLGFDRGKELFGRGWRDLLPADEAARLERTALAEGGSSGGWVGGVTFRRRDGERLRLEVSITPAEGGGTTWVARDAAWRDGAAEASERTYRSLFQAAGSVILLLSRDGEIEEWNREAQRFFHLRGGKAAARRFLDLVSEERRGEVAAELGRVAEGGGARTFEAAAGAGAEGRFLLWTVRAGEEDDGLIAVGHDITERKETEEALARQESRYRLLALNSSDLVALHDPDGRFEFASPSCEILLGYSQQELVGRDLYGISHSDDWQRIQAALVAASAGRTSRFSYRVRNSADDYIWFETLLRPIQDAEGRIDRLQSSSRDISERKAFEDRLQHQALHEPLTGLPNRTLFMDRVNQALARARRDGGSVAVMFMDLDRFKIVNDSLGHAAGDRLLAAVAQRIRGCIREGDTVSRLGGDEFGVLLEFDVDEQGAFQVAERMLRQLQPPFHIGGREVFISGSIGIAFSDHASEKAENLLRYADVAMYRAKEQGTAGFRLFDPEVDTRATRRLELESGLRRALEREELAVFYQPIISLSTGRITGMEALIRWRHPEWGTVPPGEFIPLAEESGLIVPIGAWMMKMACSQALAWEPLAGDEPISVSVNLSARQFEHAELEEMVEGTLEETGLEPGRLHLEITESELLQSSGRVDLLKRLGVRVAIDDFGTGFSSLGYLKDLRADELKIDRSFVQGLGEQPRDAAIVQTVVTLAASLGLDVTAEGIETATQLARLRQMGCTRGQGFLFARPAPAEEMSELLRTDPRW